VEEEGLKTPPCPKEVEEAANPRNPQTFLLVLTN
jgi:hypothetical protein